MASNDGMDTDADDQYPGIAKGKGIGYTDRGKGKAARYRYVARDPNPDDSPPSMGKAARFHRCIAARDPDQDDFPPSKGKAAHPPQDKGNKPGNGTDTATGKAATKDKTGKGTRDPAWYEEFLFSDDNDDWNWGKGKYGKSKHKDGKGKYRTPSYGRGFIFSSDDEDLQ